MSEGGEDRSEARLFLIIIIASGIYVDSVSESTAARVIMTMMMMI